MALLRTAHEEKIHAEILWKKKELNGMHKPLENSTFPSVLQLQNKNRGGTIDSATKHSLDAYDEE